MKALLSGLLFLAAAVPTAAQQLTFELLAPVFEIGTPGTYRVTGTPGTIPYLVHGPTQGPFDTMLPNIGVLGVGPQNLKVIPLPVIPLSGTMDLPCQLACGPSLVGIEWYGQVIGYDPSVQMILKSGTEAAEFAPGDCTHDCGGAIQCLGVQLDMCNLPQTMGNVLVEVRDGIQVIELALFPGIDLLNPPATPFSSVSGAVTIERLLYDATTNCLTLRYTVDSTQMMPGMANLPATTTFMTDWINCDFESNFPCDCSLPIQVGDQYGEYTITKIIDTM